VTEYSRFRANPGIDPITLLRAPVALITGRHAAGATLEQQLARNPHENGENVGVTPKAAEPILALMFHRAVSKDELLRLYLDHGYYGHRVYGLTAAPEGCSEVPPGSRPRRRPASSRVCSRRPAPTSRSATPPPPGRGRRTCGTGWPPPGG
jgi:hypothetical protein